MPQRSAIVVVVDRLGAGYLGPYGNTWLETREFNRLARQSFLCEHVLADSPQLELSYRAYWQGLHAMCLAEPCASRSDNVSDAQSARRAYAPTLASYVSRSPLLSGAATLLTDEPAVAEHPLASGFAEQIVLDTRKVSEAATEPEESEIVQLFAAACDWLSRARSPYLLWIHARGMSGPWDAPPEFRRHFAGPEDPEPLQFVDPPAYRLPANADPDEAWGLAQAYAGQVSLVDLGLGMLLDTLEAANHQETMFALTSPRGYPLGEHRRVGAALDGLYGELLHVPLFVRLPQGAGAMHRSQALVQPPDLFATLADWFDIPCDPATTWGRSLLPLFSGEQTTLRDRACAVLGKERAIRTPAWFLRQASERHGGRSLQEASERHGGRSLQEAKSAELFVKPDDRWEVNEVSVRCQQVVEELGVAADQFEQAAQTPPFIDPAPLSRVLADGLD